MRAYNLYYKNTKINAKPLSKDAVNEILQRNTINKKISDSTLREYNVKDIKIVECIVL